MNCPECERELHGNACRCGYQIPGTGQKPEKAKRPYYYHQCTTPGCTVMIGARIGTPIDPAICKWCQAGVSHAMQGKS